MTLLGKGKKKKKKNKTPSTSRSIKGEKLLIRKERDRWGEKEL